MSLTTHARIAGLTYLLYIALEFPTMFLKDKDLSAMLNLLGSANAIVLAVALYGVTRTVVPDLAFLAMAFRLGEAITGATESHTRGPFFFALGSTIFCYLLLRGRQIPIALAWLGLAASVLLVVLLPAQAAQLIHKPVTDLMWIPMAAFEIPVGFWLIVKGARAPQGELLAPTAAR
jgi:hypothetical protein